VVGANKFFGREMVLIFVPLSYQSDHGSVLQSIRVTPKSPREQKQASLPSFVSKDLGVAQKGQFPLYFSFAPEQKYF